MNTARLLVMMCFCSIAADAGQQSSDLERRLGDYAERLGHTFRGTWIAASQVNLTDGVDEYDAYVLSAAYLYAHINLCSSIRTLREEPRRWVAETLVGEPPGDPGPPIFVEKVSGATSSPNNKTVTDPKTYLEQLRP